ncbi:MAG TPA: TrbI/VirB10 family protein [Bryobacteraceae bacterium]|nr:TrbI/VirB10 family protein [Bryobacteraceae bacterium]
MDFKPDPELRSPDSSAGQLVADRAKKPPGLLPKNTQTYVILGIAVIMVGAILLSGRNAPAPRQTAAPLAAGILDPNAARIEDYRKRIDEQAKKLEAEQAQLSQTKQALGLNPSAPMTAGAGQYPPNYAPAPYPPPAATGKPEKSALETEKERREYSSLFASNIALTYRKSSEPQTGEQALPSVSGLPSQGQFAATSNTTPLTGRGTAPIEAAGGVPASPVTPLQTERNDAEGGAEPKVTFRSADSNSEAKRPTGTELYRDLDRADGKEYRLFEGTIIETVLTNRLNGSFDGPVNAMVTTAVYSHDRQQLLIPQGSRILGEVKRNDAFGQQRLAVFFHRIIMPDGYSVSLDRFQGLNQIGETGLRDQVNHHYVEIFGVSLAIGAIAGLAQANTSYGLDTSALDAYRQGAATSLSQSSLRILEKYLNVLPTFTIREGQRINIYLSDDLMLPAYARHKMPGNF